MIVNKMFSSFALTQVELKDKKSAVWEVIGITTSGNG